MQQVSEILQRPDGSEVKIVATAMYGAGLKLSIDTYVLRRANAAADWSVVSTLPHPDWRKMSVDEYIKHGRSEYHRTVTFAEMVKVTQKLKAQLVH